MPQLWSILLAVFLERLKSAKFHIGEIAVTFPSLLPPPFSSSFWWGDARFYFSSCFVFKTMDGEKENSLLAHSGLSHKAVFGHELSTTDIVPRGGLCFPSISPAKGKRKKES